MDPIMGAAVSFLSFDSLESLQFFATLIDSGDINSGVDVDKDNSLNINSYGFHISSAAYEFSHMNPYLCGNPYGSQDVDIDNSLRDAVEEWRNREG
jgi:hypothetical protein